MRPLIAACFLILILAFVIDGSDASRLKIKTHRFFPPTPNGEISLDQQLINLGEKLFHDKQLSLNNAISCASCHQAKYAFGDNQPKSIDAKGQSTERNTPPLFNLLWQNSLFWDGRLSSLEEQISSPLSKEGEMGISIQDACNKINRLADYAKWSEQLKVSEIDSTLLVRSIAEFEKSIISSNSKYDQVLMGLDTFTMAEQKGFTIFNDQTKAKCLHCHALDASALGSNYQLMNNGMEIIDSGRYHISNSHQDIGKFKTPSLRNLKYTAPYMHDGRFSTLEEVLDHYDQPLDHEFTDAKIEAHLGGANLTNQEREYVLAFLNTLNDATIIAD